MKLDTLEPDTLEPVTTGVYRIVAIGFTLTSDGPMWSVDIASNHDDFTAWVGTGPTLEAAAAEAQAAVLRYRPLSEDYTGPLEPLR